jgi:Zn-finger nucleic acid-binding protein
MIVACPGCDSRYDVSGYEVGQQLRCRCGQVFARQAVSAQAGMLACPHCGAGVAPTSPRCEHCSTELLLKACPRCLQRVFHGHKHCPECGAELERAAAALGDAPAELPCPRCTHPLSARLVGDIVIDECGQCLGLFLDHVAIQRVITDRAQARAETLLGALPKGETQIGVRPGEKMYLKCPTCQTIMNRKQFATGAGIIVDVCRKHGTFFDVGELPAIIDFVMQGGLEKAAKKELENQRQQLERERGKITREREVGGGLVRVSSVTHSATYSSNADRGTAIVDLLFSLFG